MEPHDLTLRPISGRDELRLFTGLTYTTDDEFEDDLAEGRRRPEWMWIALRGDRLVARAAWWTRPGREEPLLLDVFDLDAETPDRVETGVRLLRTAMAEVVARDARPPQYTRFVAPSWRDEPLREPVEDRMAALETLGARLFVERLRLEWWPGTPVRASSGRLRFRPVGDAEELIALMTDVLDGTLDAHGRDDLTRMPPREAAVGQYEDELARYDSPRNPYNAIIAYVGVRPAHRGNGHVDELLGEGTRVLAAEGVPRVRASTDLGNVPMARAFERAWYVAFEHQIDMTWS
jgi:hypothetical protein